MKTLGEEMIRRVIGGKWVRFSPHSPVVREEVGDGVVLSFDVL
jgi:hypothetical protein